MSRAATADMNMGELQSRALRAAGLLKAMSNPVRLMVLCQLAEGEKSVGELEKVVKTSQSALSQHLAVLRERGLVRARRAGQSIFYDLDGAEAPALLAALYEVYCRNVGKARRARA
ncbi:MAG TPA: metalloregulator ArsR/SmtB family transcription factor [Burkholderiales bacterium]|nr:metalloregulator ArsR/SmtB family transcription factor [Burkholderiales bacterium]